MMRKAYSKDSVGGEAAKTKPGAMPAILMALFCLIVGGIDTIMSFNFTTLFTLIRHGETEQITKLLISFATTAGHDAIEQIIGIVLIVVIIFLRKKHLSKITYKDFAVMAIFFVASLVFAKIGSTSANVAMSSKTAENALSAFAVMTKNGTFAIFTVPTLVNWLCLGVFILAKTEGKKLARIFGGAVAVIALVLSLAACIFAGKLAGVMYSTYGEAMSAAVPAVRIALLLNLFAVCVPVLFWFLYGEGQLKFVFGIIYVIVQPALVSCLTVGASIVGASIVGASIADAVAAGAPIVAKKLGLGLVVTTWGEPLAYIIGGAAIIGVLLLKKKREAQKAEKAAAKA